jgi:5-methylcytosine-specific restriction endonuclease McrA
MALGGSHELANLIALCERCHRKLHAADTPPHWRRGVGEHPGRAQPVAERYAASENLGFGDAR